MRSTKNRIMLIELALAIFTFSVCAAVCIGAFSAAKSVSEDSSNLTWAVFAAENAAEAFHAADTPEEIALMLGGVAANNTVTVGYDNNWMNTSQDEAFSLEIKIINDGQLKKAQLCVYNVSGEIFSMTTAKLGGGVW